MRREKKKKWKSKETGEKRKHKLIHTDKQTDRRTDRHKSFIDMRYNTEQYSKSNSIESYSINQIKRFKNKVE